MITNEEFIAARDEAEDMLVKAGVVVSEKEIEAMDVADFGLSQLRTEGAQILSLIDTDKIAARVIVQFPGQTEPEHWHTGIGSYEGKQETLRVISGKLYLYLPGEDTVSLGKVPQGKEEYYTVRNERVMYPTDTVTIPVGTKHWFQAGESGCVFYTMSTMAMDSMDPFTDPHVVRKTIITE